MMIIFRTISLILLMLASLASHAQTKSPKRGFCGNLENREDMEAIPNASWFYNWAENPADPVKDHLKDYIDYAPMAWGTDYNRESLRNYLIDHPEIKYLLGFNEPNFLEQANIGPHVAAALWPELESVADEFDLELVSPAVNFSWSGGAVTENGVEYTDPVQYLDTFFYALPDTARVDYIAIHGYFDNAGALPWYLGLFEKYNKPLWLTEFNHSASIVSETSQQEFMVDALNYLEQEPLLFRYAWFLARSVQINTNLFKTGSSGQLTDLGFIFNNISSYDASYYHATEDTIEAEHYVNMSGSHLIVVHDPDRGISAHNFDNGDWLDYNIDVPDNRIYNLRLRIAAIWESSFSIYIGENLIATYDIPVIDESADVYETLTYKLYLEQGKQKLRMVTHGGGWRFNYFRITSEETGTDNEGIPQESVSLYPNPLRGTRLLRCELSENIEGTISIYESTGRLIYSKPVHQSGTFDLSQLRVGVYFVRVRAGKEVFTERIIIC